MTATAIGRYAMPATTKPTAKSTTTVSTTSNPATAYAPEGQTRRELMLGVTLSALAFGVAVVSLAIAWFSSKMEVTQPYGYVWLGIAFFGGLGILHKQEYRSEAEAQNHGFVSLVVGLFGLCATVGMWILPALAL